MPPIRGPFQCLVCLVCLVCLAWGTRSAAPARATGAACDEAAMDARERWVPWTDEAATAFQIWARTFQIWVPWTDGAATAACWSGSRALVEAFGKAP